MDYFNYQQTVIKIGDKVFKFLGIKKPFSFFYPVYPSFKWETRLPKPEDAKGHHFPFGCRIPDWRQYKVSEYTPELQKLEKRLAERGLKDPWIRNEVWKHDTRLWGSPFQRRSWMLRGTATGLVVTAIIVVIKETFFPKEHHHEDKYPIVNEHLIERKHVTHH
ncbi:NADH dehydrogenase [ubiquinone] 1 beta subcomplex subunit 3-like protein [Dinothrombium tinctorium]|uniref:NADH dehydrogenase [ubiquinone] 1 beta subcomplex subunit 3-like protein n=1 Tax=Dinothrombium tinctorium TaxID=1965070 RepID=A0A443RMW0_9ACAR|nr:NADH dehydrogenase [ubiquinone] 1 beta subcomplex subunit 3-like protein [Dinothrombium tinctorium]RWS16611.1 NADH dehydrogenase [ubiquinone] 1 beta subcomplex subunit 3-like protein [Dinothrombium tinctorium]RWS17417.1 NADH dehydrogenase [ubiquinone] 1 beta subcomplex subunit 3-like protein [Dinothrombium tinctorium]